MILQWVFLKEVKIETYREVFRKLNVCFVILDIVSEVGIGRYQKKQFGILVSSLICLGFKGVCVKVGMQVLSLKVILRNG